MRHSVPWILLVLAGGFFASPASAQRIKLPVGLDRLRARAARDSLDAVAQYNVALGYWNEKRYDEARAALEDAVSLDPEFAEAYLALSQLPFARRPKLEEEVFQDAVPEEWQDDVEESDRMFRRAFLLDPFVDLKIAGAVIPPRSIYWTATEEMRKIYDELFQGFDDLLLGRYDGAFFRLDRLMGDFDWDRFPDRAPTGVLWYHGLAAAHADKLGEARKDFRHLLERAEGRRNTDSLVHVPLRTAEYRYMLGCLALKAGDLDAAKKRLREAAEEDLGLFAAHSRLADIAEKEGHWKEALAERQRAVDANPDDPGLLVDLAMTRVKRRNWAGADEALGRAEALNPRDPRTPYLLGLVEINEGKSAAARRSLERFLRMAPRRFGKEREEALLRVGNLQ